MQKILRPLASLNLTVALILLSMLLVYAGTGAQVDMGPFAAEKAYFHTVVAWVPLQTLVNPFVSAAKGLRVPGSFPMPGGYLIGLVMIVNVAAAAITRFRYDLSSVGLVLIHLSLILLLVGEGLRSRFAVETRMTIPEGGFANYSSSFHDVELAAIRPGEGASDKALLIPSSKIDRPTTFQHPDLPFSIKVEEYHPNSQLLGPVQAGASANAKATAGEGKSITVRPAPSTRGKSQDMASAYLTLSAGGQSLGTYLVSTYIEAPQEVRVGDETWQIALRFKRHYKPYEIHLIDFRHDVYPGTDKARNFSSEIRLVDPSRNEDRRVLIKMNQPLRYRGATFYQHSFRGENVTTLQVVETPSWKVLGVDVGTWQMPYLSSLVGGLGLAIHFALGLAKYARRRNASAAQRALPPREAQYTLASPTEPASLIAPALLLVGAVVLAGISWLGYQVRPGGAFDLEGFGRLPILYEGRVQPLDSVARNSLKIVSGRSTLSIDGKRAPAIRWLLETMTDQEASAKYRVFRIDDPEVKGLLRLDADEKRFTLAEILPGRQAGQTISPFHQSPELAKQLMTLESVPSGEHTRFQSALAKLNGQLGIYAQFFQGAGELYLAPPSSTSGQFQPIAMALAHPGPASEGATMMSQILAAYHTKDADAFNRLVRDCQIRLDATLPSAVSKVQFEAWFNRADLFTLSMAFYIIAFILACLSFLGAARALSRGALWTLLAGLLPHTIGLVSRIYISGRPPVTDLTSSAILIAWGGVVFAAIAERFTRTGLGTIAAATLGFLSLLVADRLSLQGDSMAVMQAVLDTNFWLATHVVAITLGYSAAFLAGLLGVIYVLRGVFTTSQSPEAAQKLTRAIYGVIAFALLLSFVGTVLGGIWADQSWGRFWGWDPKENGAALIVLWMALILHARWGRMIGPRGLAVMAIGGNIITSWSWFGTNMMGVGLHSYGFMADRMFWLMMFIFSQAVAIAIGLLPAELWRSTPKPAEAQA